MKKNITNSIYLTLVIGLIGIGFWLRFWHLDTVPAAFYHDEMDYVITGQSLLHWGTDLSDTWTPWQLRPLQTINFTAELPAVFHALTQFFAGSSPENARLTNAIWGLLTVILVGLLTIRVSGSRLAGIITSVLLWLNHWHIHISRLGYEATISLFFQTLLVYGLLTLETKKKKLSWILISLASLFFGYYTYHGAKFTLIAIVSSYLAWKLAVINKKKEKIQPQFWWIGLALVLLTAHSLWVNQLGAFGYRSNAQVYIGSNLQDAVMNSRRDRIAFIPATLLANKFTLGFQELIKRFWFVFDPNRLLFTGYEGTHQFSLVVAGYFSLIELIGLGLFFRFFKLNIHTSLLFIWLFVSPIATYIAGYQAILRSAFTYELLVIFAGWGLAMGYHRYQCRWLGWGIIVFAGIASVWFGWQYFSRYPIVTAESHMLSDRILSRYVKSSSRPMTIVVDKDVYIIARNIVYYNNMLSQITKEERSQFKFPFPSTIRVGNITVTTECPKQLTDEPLVIHPNKWQTCGLREMYSQMNNRPTITAIPSPLDNGSYYLLWHNYLCEDKGKQFVHLENLSDIAVESMHDQQFCKTWIRYEQ